MWTTLYTLIIHQMFFFWLKTFASENVFNVNLTTWKLVGAKGTLRSHLSSVLLHFTEIRQNCVYLFRTMGLQYWYFLSHSHRPYSQSLALGCKCDEKWSGIIRYFYATVTFVRCANGLLSTVGGWIFSYAAVPRIWNSFQNHVKSAETFTIF